MQLITSQLFEQPLEGEADGQREVIGHLVESLLAVNLPVIVVAAWALLRWKTPKTQALHEWATRIAARRGKATAVVALARKLAGIHMRMRFCREKLRVRRTGQL